MATIAHFFAAFKPPADYPHAYEHATHRYTITQGEQLCHINCPTYFAIGPLASHHATLDLSFNSSSASDTELLCSVASQVMTRVMQDPWCTKNHISYSSEPPAPIGHRQYSFHMPVHADEPDSVDEERAETLTGIIARAAREVGLEMMKKAPAHASSPANSPWTSSERTGATSPASVKAAAKAHPSLP